MHTANMHKQTEQKLSNIIYQHFGFTIKHIRVQNLSIKLQIDDDNSFFIKPQIIIKFPPPSKIIYVSQFRTEEWYSNALLLWKNVVNKMNREQRALNQHSQKKEEV